VRFAELGAVHITVGRDAEALVPEMLGADE
jgi:hypothetical protein